MSAPPIQPLPIIMNTEEVARLLRCEVSTVERYVHNHDLVAILIGKERRIRADDLLDFIASRESSALNGKRKG